MTQSMTGFARGSVTTGALTVTVECRSVNNRYLDLQCRMPDTLRSVEGSLREQAGTFFARGKLELLVRVFRLVCARSVGSVGSVGSAWASVQTPCGLGMGWGQPC